MIEINVNLDTGVAVLARTTAIKAGGKVLVRLIFNRTPAVAPTLEIALSAATGTPAVLAYLNTFAAENPRTFRGWLNTNDNRLITHLATLTSPTTTCAVELVVTIGGAPRPYPNVTVTVQKPIITGPTSSQSGPVYPFFLIQAKDNPNVIMKVEVLSNSQFDANPYTP